jgi:hypothetical protein
VFGYSVTKSLKDVHHECNPGAGGISLFCRFRAAGAAILVALAVLGTVPAVSAAEIVVFTAASSKEALDDAVRVYDNQSGDAVNIPLRQVRRSPNRSRAERLPTSPSRLTSSGWITFNNTSGIVR